MEMMPFAKVENIKGWPIWGGGDCRDNTQYFIDLLFDLPLSLGNGGDNEVDGKLKGPRTKPWETQLF